MNFGQKWCNYISSCLSSSSVSVLVNGSASKEFKMERGLRQRDLLSPFLFLIIAEFLQIMIVDACNKGIFKGLSLADDGSNISLLQYADDALFFGDWSVLYARHLRWRFLNEKDVLWSCKIYGSDGGFDAWRGSRQKSKRWSKIDDVWQGKWAWRRQPSGRTLTDLSSLNLLITGLVLDSAIEDKWTWALEDSGKFSVRSLCKGIQSNLFVSHANSPSFRWNSLVPRKNWRNKVSHATSLDEKNDYCNEDYFLWFKEFRYCGFQTGLLSIMFLGTVGYILLLS
nr:RNA-directed DNA polymerase, eukaryota, reverse transcriptase zinc-binding domain protein [Tanacetum cinerariifolium]